MISENYNDSVYIADFTEYINNGGKGQIPSKGVFIGREENGIIPSFVLTDGNAVPFVVVNNEKNPALFKRKDGTKVTQCECMIYASRNDNKRGWMIFLELKYCKEKNLVNNIEAGVKQLRESCNYIMDEVKAFDSKLFKKYLVISTPGTVPLDPFDASYFDQDFMLSVKEETGAVLKASNIAHIQTSALVSF